MLGFAAAEGASTFQQASERGHGIAVQWNGSMAGCRLAAADCRDSAEQIDVLPAQILDLHAATGSRKSEHRRAMRDHPFRTACGRLEQSALQIGRQNLRYCAAILRECLYVLGNGIPDLGPLQHPAKDA